MYNITLKKERKEVDNMITAFIHGNIVDVINGTLIPDGAILVEDGIIKGVGTGMRFQRALWSLTCRERH